MKLEGKKRINITCPKCHYDYFINGDAIYQRRRYLSEQNRIILAKMQAFKQEHPNDTNKHEYYQKLKRELAEVQAQLAEAKTEQANANNITELNLFVAFKKRIALELGNDRMIQLLEECEEDMEYKAYDLAKQTYTNFNNV